MPSPQLGGGGCGLVEREVPSRHGARDESALGSAFAVLGRLDILDLLGPTWTNDIAETASKNATKRRNSSVMSCDDSGLEWCCRCHRFTQEVQGEVQVLAREWPGSLAGVKLGEVGIVFSGGEMWWKYKFHCDPYWLNFHVGGMFLDHDRYLAVSCSLMVMRQNQLML